MSVESRPPRGRLFLIGGPSAVGKTTLSIALAEAVDNLEFLSRYTTRRPRGAPTDAVEYRPISQALFDQYAAEERFIEYRNYDFGMSYGLDRETVDRYLSKGSDCVAVINIGTLDQVRRNAPDAVTIFLYVDLPVIEQRMRERGDHTEEQITERLANARLGLAEAEQYDYVVRNDGAIEDALDELAKIVVSSRQ